MKQIDGRILQVKKRLGASSVQPNKVIEEMAQKFNITPSYLQQLFKKEVGTTILQYDRDVRMEKAKHLLTTTHQSVKVICHILGFKEYTHFLRDFKKKYKISPKEAQRKSWVMKEE